MSLVSIIICTYNNEKYISRAIESVLMQSYRNFELIILNDASTDNTEVLIKKYISKDKRIKYFKNNQNRGNTKSRNRACNIAQGKYIAMLDSDDWWLSKEKIQKQVEFLNNNLNVGLVGTSIVLYDVNFNFIKEDIFEIEDDKIRKKILLKNQFAQSSIMFRKDIYIISGKYDESLYFCQDYDLWLRIGIKYRLANLPESMTAYLINPKGVSKLNRKKIYKITDKIIKKYKFDYPGFLRAKIKSIIRMLLF